MTFGQSISTCFGKYATFSGRASRSEYWWFVLFLTGVDILIGFIEGWRESGPLSNVWTLVTFIPLLSVAWRRLHDIGRSGAWSLMPLAPAGVFVLLLANLPWDASPGLPMWLAGIATIVAVIVTLVWFATPSADGPNQYGEHPFR